MVFGCTYMLKMERQLLDLIIGHRLIEMCGLLIGFSTSTLIIGSSISILSALGLSKFSAISVATLSLSFGCIVRFHFALLCFFNWSSISFLVCCNQISNEKMFSNFLPLLFLSPLIQSPDLPSRIL